LSTAALMLPSAATIRRTITTIAGMAQKSPHTHKMPAPICWSANGGRVMPGMWS
jgi:hypothetical protein